MPVPPLPKGFGRTAFGGDPANYDRARSGYPEWVFDTLRTRCGLCPGTPTFEIGPGTGKATRRLLDLGADPLTAIEPDTRLADWLRKACPDPRLTIVAAAFEDARLPEAAFRLGVAATAFHWLDEDRALADVARLLQPGGWWAAIWNTHGDAARPDPFHDATRALLDGPPSPADQDQRLPFGLDVAARQAALERNGAFDVVDSHLGQWTLTLDADQTVALYATFSNITARPDRTAVLAELGRIAREDFGGRVIRNMTTSLFIARRAG